MWEWLYIVIWQQLYTDESIKLIEVNILIPQQNKNSDVIEILKTYKKSWSEENYSVALGAINEAIALYPDSIELLWYRCCCFELLGQHQKALDECNARREAINQQIERLDELYEQTEDEGVYDELETQKPQNLHDLSLFKLTVQAMPEDICLFFQEYLEGDKQVPIYDRLIELKPDSHELYYDRGNYYQTIATSFELYADEQLTQEQREEKINTNPDIVRDFAGVIYSKFKLKKALFNYQKAISLAPGSDRYYIKAARTLHLLKRYDEALNMYDQALGLIDKDDPKYQIILEQRRASEDGGKGEHHQLADILANSLGDMKNRSIEDDAVYAMLKSMEEAVRSGAGIQGALDELVSDDPHDMVALNIARQIYDVANEPAMKFVEIDLKTFPSYHSKHILNVEKQAKALGYTLLAYVHAPNVSAMIGQEVAMGVFCAPDFQSAMAAFTLKPKWPGKIGFLLMLLTGKWRKHHVVDISTAFNNDHCIGTRRTAIAETLKGGPFIHLKVMKPRTSLKELVQTHARRIKKFQAKHPKASPILLRTLEDIENASANEMKLKRQYRRSIQYVTDAELQTMLGKHYKVLAKKVREKLATIAQADSV